MRGMSVSTKKPPRKKKSLEEIIPDDYLEWLRGIFLSNICEKEKCEPCSTRTKIASLLLRAKRSKKSGNYEASYGHLCKAQELLDLLVTSLEASEVGINLQISLAMYVQNIAARPKQADILYHLGSSLSYMRTRTDRTSN